MNERVSSEPADIETSSDRYAQRFAGPVGEWMLRVQAQAALALAGPAQNRTVLDVGGGHGQLAAPFCAAGFQVTVAGSTEPCSKRIGALLENDTCRFQACDLFELPFSDGAFDLVLCFRLLTHSARWEQLVGELSRVARQAVIVDYPTSQSLNKVAPLLFGAKKRLEGDTRTWTLFRHRDIDAAFAPHDYAITERRPQFFLPMVLHRILKCQPVSAGLETVCRRLGLTRLLGSPVVAKAVRKELGTNGATIRGPLGEMTVPLVVSPVGATPLTKTPSLWSDDSAEPRQVSSHARLIAAPLGIPPT